jgi:hypothetical protein
MPTYKRHFAPGHLQFLTSSTYRRAKLLESDRFRLLAAEPRSAPACGHFHLLTTAPRIMKKLRDWQIE